MPIFLPIALAAAAPDEESGMGPAKRSRAILAGLAYSRPMP